MFDSLGGMGSFLLGIIVLQDVYDSHKVNLLPGSTFSYQTNRHIIRIHAFAQNNLGMRFTVAGQTSYLQQGELSVYNC